MVHFHDLDMFVSRDIKLIMAKRVRKPHCPQILPIQKCDKLMEQLLVVSLSTQACPQMTQTSYPLFLMISFSHSICVTGHPAKDQQ